MKKPSLLAASLLAAACATAPPAPAPKSAQSPTPAATPPPVSAEEMVDHFGDSVETAVPVPEDASDGGVPFEEQWMFDRFGPFKKVGSGTGVLASRRYDVVTIQLPSGETKKVFFDITENWAKWGAGE